MNTTARQDSAEFRGYRLFPPVPRIRVPSISTACSSRRLYPSCIFRRTAPASLRRSHRRAACATDGRSSSQRARHLLHLEALDDVAGLDVLVVLEGHAALVAFLDLADLVLEAL